MNGEYPFCETDPLMDDLKKAAFSAIYKDACTDWQNWIDTLINCYSNEVVNALGDNPFDINAELEDMWNTVDYEDPQTGVCLTYQNWAEYFAGEFGHIIYDELIKAKKMNGYK